MSIKDIIKGLDNPFVRALILIRRLNKDEVFSNWVKGYESKTNVLDFKEFGDLNKDKNIYLMRFDSSVSGFFANWKRGLTGLAFAERYKLTPVIDWTENNLYYEKGYGNTKNPFEYYYEPVSQVSVEDVYKSYNVVFYGKNSSGDSYKQMLYDAEFDIDMYSKLLKKYYRLKQPILEKLNLEINNIINKKKTLAVQIRGVDWGNIQGHPIPPSLEIYIEEIDKAIKKCGFEQIFLATDAEETVEYISNKYPGKVVVYSDVARTPKGSKTLVVYDSSIKRENNNFLMGYEVLRDMLTLTSCQGIIASYTNISFAVEVTKKSIEEEFEYKYIIKADINQNGLTPKQATDLQKQGKFKG